MFQPRSIQSSMTLRDKVMSMDFILIFSILILGIVSMFAMYSTDGGKFDYHTKSHILRFGIFFIMFLLLIIVIYRKKTVFDPETLGTWFGPCEKLPKIAFLTCFYSWKYFLKFESFRKCLKNNYFMVRKALKFVSWPFSKNFDFGLVYTLVKVHLEIFNLI